MRLMTEKTYQRLVEDVRERMEHDVIDVIKASRARVEAHALNQTEIYIQDAVNSQIEGESFLDGIVDRIMRKQLCLHSHGQHEATKARGLRRVDPESA